ncbi:MAG: hypothetical protein Q9195_002356 [Heterodermia aff. obscurata]
MDMEVAPADRWVQVKPLPAITVYEYRLWRIWRLDRERFRKLGVWGGDVNGEIGQGHINLHCFFLLVIFSKALGDNKTKIPDFSIGPWSLAGWDGVSDFYPTKPGSRSLRSMGGGFEWSFYWDPFLGALDDVRFPDDGAKKGLEKLLEEERLKVPSDAEEASNEIQTRVLTYGVLEKKKKSADLSGEQSGEEFEMIAAMLKDAGTEDRDETEVGSALSQNMSEESSVKQPLLTAV